MYTADDQVFVAEPEEVDASELYQKVVGEVAKSAASMSDPLTGVKRKFTADNGVNYIWDDEEDCWVVDEEGDNDNNVEEDENQFGSDEDDEDEYKHQHESKGDPLNTINQPPSEQIKKKKNKSKNKKPKKIPNNWVYISGLPSNITEDEIKAHFSKVGLIAISPLDQRPKIKIYRDDMGDCKGDATLCFNATESVEMAVNYLDGGYIRPTHKISVSQAEFQHQQNASIAANDTASTSSFKQPQQRRPKVSHAQVKVVKSAMNQALSWNEDDDIGVSKSQALKIVVLQGMFHPSDFDNPDFSDELESDIASECSKCGQIEKITVFSKNKLGVVIVKFSTSYAAQECIKLMDGRYFAGRRLRSFFWDGTTDYSASSDSKAMDNEEKEEKARIEEFGDWLEKDQEELPEEFMLRNE